MQIISLHKNIYKLAYYAIRQEEQEKYVKEREKLWGDWELLKSRKVPDKEIAKVTGISRSTYFRRKKALAKYGILGLKRKSSRPKRVRQSKIPEEVIKFLRKVIEDMPFKVRSIQVDGGSEFMKHFEDQAKKLSIPLYVLPPKSPQHNGGVERGNRIFREEFYSSNIDADSIADFQYHLQQAVHKYNTYRPHFNLNGLTPLEYTNQILNV